MTLGIVVEGQSDVSVYSTIIRRIRPDVNRVLPKPCGGASCVRQQMVGWLKNFQWHAGHNVQKALIIRDSDCRDPQAVEDELAHTLSQSRFQPTFPVHFYATKCELETWLLADENAVNVVAERRQKAPSANAVLGLLEGIRDAKERFIRMLSQSHLPAVPSVYGEVASSLDLDRVQERCPYFRKFVERVRAC